MSHLSGCLLRHTQRDLLFRSVGTENLSEFHLLRKQMQHTTLSSAPAGAARSLSRDIHVAIECHAACPAAILPAAGDVFEASSDNVDSGPPSILSSGPHHRPGPDQLHWRWVERL